MKIFIDSADLAHSDLVLKLLDVVALAPAHPARQNDGQPGEIVDIRGEDRARQQPLHRAADLLVPRNEVERMEVGITQGCARLEAERPQTTGVSVGLGLSIAMDVARGHGGSLELEAGKRYLINPGSIGQPRDRDPRAAYMTYDSDKRIVRWHRVEYPVERAQQRIVKAGLPKVLADRLALGV